MPTRTNQESLPWNATASPQKKFALLRKNLSEAAGGKKDAGPDAGGHPFDVELAKLPPGKINFPLHHHAAQWEAYLIVSGQGSCRTLEKTSEVAPGDFLVFPPGEAHQFINSGTEDLVYYVFANNSPADLTYYPDSKKWAAKPGRLIFDQTVDYFQGEE